MSASEDSGFVGSSDSEGHVQRRFKRDFAALLVADDDVDVVGLPEATRGAILERADNREVPDVKVTVLGIMHVQWVLSPA